MQNVFAGPVMLVFWHHRASTCLRAWTFSNSVLAAQRAGTAVLASPCVQAAINVAAAGNVSALFRRILALAQLANLLRVHLSQFAVCSKKRRMSLNTSLCLSSGSVRDSSDRQGNGADVDASSCCSTSLSRSICHVDSGVCPVSLSMLMSSYALYRTGLHSRPPAHLSSLTASTSITAMF